MFTCKRKDGNKCGCRFYFQDSGDRNYSGGFKPIIDKVRKRRTGDDDDSGGFNCSINDDYYRD